MKRFLFLLLFTSSIIFAQPVSDDTLMIKFDEFTFVLPNFAHWVEQPEKINLNDVEDDTVKISVDLGEDINNRKFYLLPGKGTENVLITEFYETSLSIMNEGPHIDLLDWKHFYSEPDTLSAEDDLFVYKTVSYNYEDFYQNFPDVSGDEIRDAIRDHLDDDFREHTNRWVELAKDVESPFDPPAGVGLSTIFINVTGLDSDGEEFTKVIEFLIPMGC